MLTKTGGLVGGILVALAATALLACGGSSSSSSSSSSTSAGGESSAASGELASLFKGEGYTAPPTSGPKPQQGKKIWVLSCGQSITNCSVAADSAVEAGKKLGWDVTLYDTKFATDRIAQGVRQAIASKADGIMTYLIDCGLAAQPLAEARKAGVKTSAGEALNCATGGYDSVVSYGQGDFPTWLDAYGEYQGKVAAAATDGKAKAILLKVADVPTAVTNWEATIRGLKTCGGCSVAATVSFTNAETGAKLQQKVQQTLLQHPEANAIITPADAYLNGGVLAALRATGRLNKMFIGLGEGDPTTMKSFQEGNLTNAVGVGIPEAWEAYAAVDNLNRLFAGEKPVNSGIGLQAFDANTNAATDGGPFEPSVDWREAYSKLWGVQ